jgi:hypothetical protein
MRHPLTMRRSGPENPGHPFRNGSKVRTQTEELLRAMPNGSQPGAAYREERLPLGRAILLNGLLSALSWAVLIAIAKVLL